MVPIRHAPKLRAAILGAALLTACSSSAPSTPGPVEPTVAASSACDLLSQEEIRSAVGAPVGAGVGSPLACTWQGAPGDASASLALVPSSDPAACVGQRPEGADPVKDLGLDAWWDPTESDFAFGTITVCLDDAHMTITLTADTSPDALGRAARELAALAIGRR